MRHRRVVVARAAVAGVLSLGVLGGCSESPEDVRADYCEEVEDRQVELSEIMAEDSPATLLRALPVFRDLAAEAPRDIADEWELLIGALDGLDAALNDAGVEPADYDADDPPPGVSEEQQRAIARAADELASGEVAAAYEGVQQQAKDVCQTPLYR
ncbi:hypothetical protein [Nocardioides coralli]|uniref:hypothetical protein n=1 Tax=Nocardioides coralli TaxID=2872154 RepID=UPI001CA45308|nr:hypothetical protein [Nocardioides coralli]QZY30522.1 hypothetical protein K6T13_07715 [Nocardioides coralli]